LKVRGTEIQLGVGEVLKEGLETTIALPGLTEIGLRVEIDVAEHPLQLLLVGVLFRAAT